MRARLLESEFLRAWQDLALPEPYTLLLSGGGDSVALFHLLKTHKIPFFALHFVHDGDPDFGQQSREFCEELCGEVPLEVVEIEGKPLVAEGDLSWEAACRTLRYRQLARRTGSFLTAHTADDQVETVLMRLLAGSGLAGLSGVKRVREDGVARPLLDFSRQQLREYLESKGHEWVDDPTNIDGNLRAQVRHKVVPALLDQEPSLLQAVNRTAGFLRQDEQFIQQHLEAWLAEYSNEQGDSWPLLAMQEMNPALRGRLLKRIWAAFSPAGFRPRGTLFEEVEKLLAKGRNDAWVEFPGGWALGVLGEKVWARPVLPKNPVMVAENPRGAWHLAPGWEIRTRQTGDTFRGRCLRKVLASVGHPPWVRDRWPILADGHRILAIWEGQAEEEALASPTHEVKFDPYCLRGTVFD